MTKRLIPPELYKTASAYEWTQSDGKLKPLGALGHRHLHNLRTYLERRLPGARKAHEDHSLMACTADAGNGFSGLEDKIEFLSEAYEMVSIELSARFIDGPSIPKMRVSQTLPRMRKSPSSKGESPLRFRTGACTPKVRTRAGPGTPGGSDQVFDQIMPNIRIRRSRTTPPVPEQSVAAKLRSHF